MKRKKSIRQGLIFPKIAMPKSTHPFFNAEKISRVRNLKNPLGDYDRDRIINALDKKPRTPNNPFALKPRNRQPIEVSSNKRIYINQIKTHEPKVVRDYQRERFVSSQQERKVQIIHQYAPEQREAIRHENKLVPIKDKIIERKLIEHIRNNPDDDKAVHHLENIRAFKQHIKEMGE